MRQLLKRGAEVRYCDPHVSEVLLDDLLHRSVEWSADEIGAADCVVLLTAHSAFADSGPWDAARLVVDTRNAVPGGPAVRLI